MAFIVWSSMTRSHVLLCLKFAECKEIFLTRNGPNTNIVRSLQILTRIHDLRVAFGFDVSSSRHLPCHSKDRDTADGAYYQFPERCCKLFFSLV
ncbi:hypothetical protein M3J09_003821 [Ascochyta lentis]